MRSASPALQPPPRSPRCASRARTPRLEGSLSLNPPAPLRVPSTPPPLPKPRKQLSRRRFPPEVPPQVSSELAPIARHRHIFGLPNPFPRSAGPPRVYPGDRGAQSASAAPPPRAPVKCRLCAPPNSPPTSLRCSSGGPKPWVSTPSSPSPLCARCRRPWRTLGAQAPCFGELCCRRAALAVEEPFPSPASPL